MYMYMYIVLCMRGYEAAGCGCGFGFCSGELSIQVAVEMPFDIKTIDSPTHKIKMKVRGQIKSEEKR